MIVLSDLHLAFGGEPIFGGLTWAIKPGQRAGLVGPNGAGKTTLLRVVAGLQPVDAGEVVVEGETTVGYLAQDVQEMDLQGTPLSEALHAFDDVLALEAEERALIAQMEAHPDHTAEGYMKLVERFDRVHAQLVAREAHTAKPRTEAVLHGLGFSVDEMTRPLATFSGGWRMRVALARILLKRPSVLLLDEPTNHLDIESIAWFEAYLADYPGAVVLVSHDRYFLDRMVTHVAELAHGRIEEYTGNYSAYLEQREERRVLQRAAYENQQKMIADTERFIERFRYKATKATQVQSRIKMLEKLERVPPPANEPPEIRFRFPDAPPSGRTVVALSKFSKAYPTAEGGRNVVFDGAGPLAVEKGDKVALIGKNGAGKSTLARVLLGQEPFDGTREEGYRVVPAFFAQHQAEALAPDRTVLESLREVARGQSDTELRTLLGAFLFQGDDVFKPVAVLSGGEKSRLALARTLLSPANFLVLDEPTNHLDIASKKVLAEALRQYTGSFVLISHDRHFIDQVVNRVWYAEDGTVRVYDGTFSEAHWQRTHGTAAAMLKATAEPASAKAGGRPPTAAARPEDRSSKPAARSGPKTKEQKRAEAEARNALYRAMKGEGTVDASRLDAEQRRRALALLEEEVMAKEAEKEAIEAALADPALYQDQARFSAEMARFTEAEQALKALYARWEKLAEEVAALG
ncbi:MAG TPA: ABC-F family ATP-binding cassette domain-containing protein [Rubricoccaceae bacterium]|nr:ABC-F family ATP-binding cassette domain-containing protein [Rubricoccaceae bacterium]